MMKHDNNIGFLRLVFASMVIIAHGYVLLGMAMSEPLARYTQTFTLGSVGVDGFFILSGYLITNSMIRSSSPGDYLLKRVLRIYPAFIVAYAIGGLVAMQAHPGYAPEWWRSLFLFHPPEAAATPDGSSFTANSPMWTIAYEFRCYLGVMILAAAGWLANRRRMTQLTVALWLLYLLIRIPQLWHVRAFKAPLPIDILLGNILPSIRFFAIFAIGMLIYLYREEIIPRLDGRVALACLAGIALTISDMLLGESVFMLLGAVVIFWLAFRVDLGRLRQINDRWDISYCTYLYG
ncbi:MAG: acyltransferase, partial [Sphingomonas sp.]|nr:acyltransferase [Sphingomonas sp.]